jgi:hypothetical protein
MRELYCTIMIMLLGSIREEKNFTNAMKHGNKVDCMDFRRFPLSLFRLFQFVIKKIKRSSAENPYTKSRHYITLN